MKVFNKFWVLIAISAFFVMPAALGDQKEALATAPTSTIPIEIKAPEGTCLRIDGPIHFTANEAKVNSAGFIAGNPPDGPGYGTVMIGGTGPQIPGSYTAQSYAADISVTIEGHQPSTELAGDRRERISGWITLSAAEQQHLLDIAQQHDPYSAPGYGAPTLHITQASVCVSGLAFNLGTFNGRVYGAVYVYLNNSSYGSMLLVKANTNKQKTLDAPIQVARVFEDSSPAASAR